MAVLGHVTPEMTFRYAHLASDTIAGRLRHRDRQRRRRDPLRCRTQRPVRSRPHRMAPLRNDQNPRRSRLLLRTSPPAHAPTPTSANNATTTPPPPNSAKQSPPKSTTSNNSKPTPTTEDGHRNHPPPHRRRPPSTPPPNHPKPNRHRNHLTPPEGRLTGPRLPINPKLCPQMPIPSTPSNLMDNKNSPARVNHEDPLSLGHHRGQHIGR